MPDLISRAAAIDAIVGATAFPDEDYIKSICQNPANSEDWLGGVCDAINAVEEVNAVDAEPVVHGRWEEHEDYDGDSYYTCSVCDCHWVMIDGTPAENGMSYCPNCGAKMDGERREATP